MKTKKCGRCKSIKEVSEFYVDNKTKDKLQSKCKTCSSECKRIKTSYQIIQDFKDMENEVWKDVVGWEGKYMVSNMGRLKSVQRLINGVFGKRVLPECLLRLNYEKYVTITLADDNKRSKKKVHRLVGEAFIPNPNNYPIINHLKGNKHDNRATELEWTTSQRNSLHSFEIGLQSNKGENHPRSKLNLIQVNDIRELLKIGISAKELATKYNVHKSLIYYIKNGKIWSS